MSLGYSGKTVNRSREVIQQQAVSEQESRYGEMPGKVIEFFPETQTALIQPLYKPKHNGAIIELPVLEDVPVRFDRCIKGAITFAIQPDDIVLLRPQMRSTELYHTTGEYVASDTRSFALSDMEAYIDGGETLLKPIENFDPDYLHIRFDELGGFGIKASDEGKIRIDLLPGELMAKLIEGFSALASEPELINKSVYLDVAAFLTEAKLP